jgi:HAD superfamily hydrolase (TIGR01457 family)
VWRKGRSAAANPPGVLSSWESRRPGASPGAGTGEEADLPHVHPGLFDGYVLDLDGTVYLGGRLLPGARATIAALRARGRRVVFLSNNPLFTREQYAARLTRLGIPAAVEDVVNSSRVMVEYLLDHAPGARLFVIGEAPFRAELEAAGFKLTDDPRRVDVVVAAFDRSFDYRKLSVAYAAIRRGARFVATNPDPYCPTPGGGLPDCAAVTAAIEACTGARVEEVVGKPSPVMARAALARLGVPADRALMVGDRLETDIVMGIRAGMHTALVLTGATRREDLARAPVRPEFVLEDLRGLLPASRPARRPARGRSRRVPAPTKPWRR